MKVSELWLREWVSPPLDTSALVSQLTMAGLEVDSVTSVSGRFHSVVVAEVVEVRTHPDADKLRVCMVACGSEGLLQVVCCAANVRPGLRVPLAKVGAVLCHTCSMRHDPGRNLGDRRASAMTVLGVV